MAADSADKIRVGVLGQGRSGYAIHCNYLKTDERYEIAAICDPDAVRREHAEQEFGCPTFEDYSDLLEECEDLDLIINATPSHLHVPVSLDILYSGFNLVCEKPLARRVADVDELILAAEQSGVVFTIFQQSRYAPYFRQVRKVLASGVLGRPVHIKVAFNGFARRWDWQTLQEFGGGNLLNTGPHPMDQALQLFGPGMPTVNCWMDRANTFGDAEDFVKVILSGEGRPLIEVEISSCDAYPNFTYQIHGTQGGLTGGMKELKWKYYRPEEAPYQELIREPLPKQAYCREDLPMHEETWTLGEDQSDLFQTMSGAYYSDLYETLVNGAPLTIHPHQVRRQIMVMEECHRQCPLSRLGE